MNHIKGEQTCSWLWPILGSSATALFLLGISVIVFVKYGGRIQYPFVQDDAYYYFVVASNALHGYGQSLDGINWTNGFHPLWFLSCLLIFKTFTLGSVNAILTIQVLSLLLYGLALYLLCHILRQATAKRLPIICICLAGLYAPFVSSINGGLEGAILVPLQCLAYSVLARYPEVIESDPPLRRRKASILLGIILGLAALARLDFILCYLPLGLAIVFASFRSRKPLAQKLSQAILRGSMVFVPASAILVPYFLWNFINTQHLIPISAALKSTFPQPGLYLKSLSDWPHYYALTIVILAWLIISRNRPADWRTADYYWRLTPITPLLWGPIIHGAYLLLFMPWGIHNWYFAQYVPAALLSGVLVTGRVCHLLDTRVGKHVNYYLIVALGAAVISATSLAYSIGRIIRADHSSFARATYDAGVWVGANTPSDTLCAMRDCGRFTYTSQRKCVNLDGLINSWGFQQVLASGRLAEWFTEHNVRYFIVHAVSASKSDYDSMEFRFPSYLLGGASTVRVRRENEVYRSAAYNDAGKLVFLAIWRLPTYSHGSDMLSASQLLSQSTKESAWCCPLEMAQ